MDVVQTVIFIAILYLVFRDMSWIKDINELPLSAKSFGISVICFMPFWFMILYHYFPRILEIGWYEKMLFVFVPTILWYGLEYLAMYNGIAFFNAIDRRSDDVHSAPKFWIVVVADGVFYLAVITLIAYYFKFDFETFAWAAFSFRIGSCVLIFAMRLLATIFR